MLSSSCLSLTSPTTNETTKKQQKYSFPPPLHVHSPSPISSNLSQERRSPSLFDLRSGENEEGELLPPQLTTTTTKYPLIYNMPALSVSSIVLNQPQNNNKQKIHLYQQNNKRYKQKQQQQYLQEPNYFEYPTPLNDFNKPNYYIQNIPHQQHQHYNHHYYQHKLSTSNRLPLSNRYNKSCDWLAPFPRAKCSIESYGHEENYSTSNYRLNPIAQVN
ncbi:unnamed protein product [Meloidogyne enterolobii]|uniref:Uncharacterized protein n=1 Tax=Meloidogyne enterolobii TaxID=390850 RepID=A0ACB0XXT9_MELEN